jgi:hypothetical protein
MNARELGATLAGLRLVQQHLTNGTLAKIPEQYTDDGAFPGLSIEEIDALCERINVAEPRKTLRDVANERGIDTSSQAALGSPDQCPGCRSTDLSGDRTFCYGCHNYLSDLKRIPATA